LLLSAVSIALAMAQTPSPQAPEWSPKEAPIMTRWAKGLQPQRVHREYPRPQMIRSDWQNLNGLWDLRIRTAEGNVEQHRILVPFPVESALSGVMRPVLPTDTLVYRRTFSVPRRWAGRRLRLHFGAVDHSAQVLVNGKEVGVHQGGYDPFSFDVTDALKPTGEQVLEVLVTDPTDAGPQPRGKQVLKPEGIWYTPVSGIWQTVWIEPVHERAIRSLHVETDLDAHTATVRLDAAVAPSDRFFVKVLDGEETLVDYGAVTGPNIGCKVRNPKLWSPEKPYLYGLIVGVKDSKGNVLDQVRSYFAFRQISLGKDEQGRTRIFLNGKPYFLIGPLDQGYWPDGLYTAPSDAALRYDLEVTKRLGFNFVRKHVKVEPARWYWHCDRMGLLVFQDMPSGDKYIGSRDPDIERTPASAAQFQKELKAMIESFRFFPSVVGWVVFNEGWGQWKTAEMTELTRRLDPGRLVVSASGWTDRGTGDLIDWHAYPGPAAPSPEADRASFLGEFGGLGLPMPGHMWQKTGWGYRSYKTVQELTDGIVALFQNLRFLIHDPGLSGAVYTQTTDVEQEVNGLMTYDRALIKPNARELSRAVAALFLPPPQMRTIVPTSESAPQSWSYQTLGAPNAYPGFEKVGFDDSKWPRGPGGFGTEGTPGAVVRTTWASKDIWLRRSFHLGTEPILYPHVRIHHDEDVEVYLDGTLLLKRTGYTTGYVLVPIPRSEANRLTPGQHTLAVHCRQTGGGQYVDVGIVDVVER
jgi:hypothetical protein